MGSEWHVYTDNNPIVHFQSSKASVSEMRWIAQLSDFNIKMHFHSGKANANTDALSRQATIVPTKLRNISVETRIPTEPKEVNSMSTEEIISFQDEEEEFVCVKMAVIDHAKCRESWTPAARMLWNEKERLELIDGVQYRRIEKNYKVRR